MPDTPPSDGPAPPGPLSPAGLQRLDASLYDRILTIGPYRFGERRQPLRESELAQALRARLPQPGPSAERAAPGLGTKALPERLPAAQAASKLPFALRLPRWAPDGFRLQDEAQIVAPQAAPAEPAVVRGPATVLVWPSAHLLWRHADGRVFGLDASLRPEARPGFFLRGVIDAALDTVTAVTVNGQLAALLSQRRGFRPDTGEILQIDGPELLWQVGEVDYQLRALGRGLTPGELVRIAESI